MKAKVKTQPQTDSLMGHLTNVEKGQILALYHERLTIRQMGKAIKRDPSTVHRFLARYKAGKRTENPRNALKLTDRSKRNLLRVASNGILNRAHLKNQLKLSVTVRRVQQILRGTDHLKYRKLQRSPALTPHHRLEREKWARRFISRGNPFWTKVNLDDPDGLGFY